MHISFLGLVSSLLLLLAAATARAEPASLGPKSTLLLGIGANYQMATREAHDETVQGQGVTGALMVQAGVRVTSTLALAVYASVAGRVESEVVFQNVDALGAHGGRYTSQPIVLALSTQLERGRIVASPRVGVNIAQLSEREVIWGVPRLGSEMASVGNVNERTDYTAAVGMMLGVDLASTGPHRLHLFANGDANLGGDVAQLAGSLGLAFRY